MGRRVGIAALVAALLLSVAPGLTSSSHAADEPDPLTVELDFTCFGEAKISSDSKYFVCAGEHDATTGWDLYSVPIDGTGNATRLSPELGTPQDHVSWFDVTADGTTVVFAHGSTYGNDDAEDRALYSVPIDGGDVTALTPDVATGNLVWMPELAPDGSRVVFWWYTETEGGLYSVLTNGDELTLIAEPPDPQLLLEPAKKISPDSSYVHYYTGFGASSAAYAVSITGGTSVRVTGTSTSGGAFQAGWITPDSSHYVYLADHDTVGVTELYTSPLAGGAITKLNHPLALGEEVSDLVEIIPNSSGVLYSAIGGFAPTWYQVSFGGGTPVEISEAFGEVHVSPDSSTVVLVRDVTMAYPLDGGPGVQLANRGSLLVSPDSSTVWIWQNDDLDGIAQLYSVPIGGGALQLHPGTAAPSENSDGYLVGRYRMHATPDSSRLVYAADADDNGTTELMVVPASGAGAYQLADDVFIWTDEESAYSGLFQSPDSTRVVYMGDAFGTGPCFCSSLLTRYPQTDDVDWELDEDASIGSSVGVVSASDPDGDPLTFAISGSAGPFDLDANSGNVTVAAALDYETVTEHQFEIEVSDGIVSSTSLVTIGIGNVNDNPPIAENLEVSVSEDTPAGTELGSITSSDVDGDPLHHSLTQPNGLFTVDPDGTVTLIASLDYEANAVHQFEVYVDDGVFTDISTVTVAVTDVDEISPPTTTTTLPPPAPDFDDVPGTSAFHGDILWLATQGITRGCNPPVNDQYCPDSPVTRGQMAAFLHRALSDTLIPGTAVDFTDDDYSTFEAEIEWLASVGITKGCNPPTNTEFCPNSYVTRGQMAAFLDRALNLPEPVEPDLFNDDDGSLFETQIDQLATAGITRGCNPPTNTNFCPDSNVTRAQMAAFLHRALRDI